MNKIILITAVTIISCISVFAQNTTIEGNIKQIDSTSTLFGVSVYLEKTNMGASTNGNGNYIIRNVPKGDYTLVISNMGYHTIKKGHC